jgi:hypothetical protein
VHGKTFKDVSSTFRTDEHRSEHASYGDD